MKRNTGKKKNNPRPGVRSAAKPILRNLLRSGSITEYSDDAIIGNTIDGIIISWNNGAEKMYGYSREQAVHKSIDLIVPSERRDEMKLILRKLKAKENISNYDTIRCTKSGRMINVSVSVSPICDSHGKVIGALCIARDTTERNATEKALKESEARLRDITENTSDWIWEVDERMRYVYSNRRVTELLGYTVTEIIGKSPFDFMPMEEAERLRRMMTALANRPVSFKNLENINIHKDGTVRILETSGIPIFNAHEQFVGFRGIDRDVTERKTIEAEKERLIGELQSALNDVKILSGLIPICSSCKKIRDDRGYWNVLEAYLMDHTSANFTHGICPECMAKLYPDIPLVNAGPPGKT